MSLAHPEVTFNSLPHADGSATYSCNGYTITGTVNGPIEAQRRDELPEESFLEINLRPASGTGGPRERLLETLLHSTLRSLILTHAHPRSLIQLTLQILRTPSAAASSAPVPQTASHLPSLPPLLHTGLLALLNGNVPLTGTATSVLVALSSGSGKNSAVVLDPTETEVAAASSLHVFAWSSRGELVLAESEGAFEIEEWEEAAEAARKRCIGAKGGAKGGAAGDADVEMGDATGNGSAQSLDGWLRTSVSKEMTAATRWRGEV